MGRGAVGRWTTTALYAVQPSDDAPNIVHNTENEVDHNFGCASVSERVCYQRATLYSF